MLKIEDLKDYFLENVIGISELDYKIQDGYSLNINDDLKEKVEDYMYAFDDDDEDELQNIYDEISEMLEKL